jgi:hypothetical protein
MADYVYSTLTSALPGPRRDTIAGQRKPQEGDAPYWVCHVSEGVGYCVLDELQDCRLVLDAVRCPMRVQMTAEQARMQVEGTNVQLGYVPTAGQGTLFAP